MFASYLKKKRKEQKVTQSEIVENLKQFQFDAFESLDNVTLSRWERGVTEPSRYKQLLITRFFNDDLSEFLLAQHVENDFKELRKIFYDRYESVYSFSNRLKYGEHQANCYQVFEMEALSAIGLQDCLSEIEGMHKQFGIPDSEMFRHDFHDLIADKCGEFRVYLNNASKAGHYLAYYFEHDEFLQQMEQSSCTPDYSKACNKERNSHLVMFSSSRFFEAPCLRLYNVYREVITAINNPNIQYFAMRVVTQSAYNYYSHRGFSVVACEGEGGAGEFVIGGKKYRQAIMMADINRLLSSDYLIALYQHYAPMACVNEQLHNSFI
ncbi:MULTISPECIES: helix-turn-helix domain-containing protein [Vibrio]|uniref:Transcriptional regulator n=1 Tax=Vibrio bivalvicida TaxID=1276888 RepID=A0A177Y318_9VIBR|nr:MULTISPECIES: helix-turn-helix transcriptional regulator [Vibrio]KLN65054.1 transcriptional regulator [Vibrio sp. VPAP30]OAJ94996.1 transcriptional regulator [Vibrio bivalvicida]